MPLTPLNPWIVRAFLLVFCCGHVLAQWQAIGNVTGVDKITDGVMISAGPAKLTVTVVAPDVFRVRMTPRGEFAPDSSWAVINRTIGSTAFTMQDSGGAVTLTTDSGRVRISKNPCRISFFNHAGALINSDDNAKGMEWSGNEVAVWKTMPDGEHYYGFGEKAGRLERRNTAMTNWNSDIPAYGADTDPLYETIPFFYGIRTTGAYGIFFDNSWQSHFDMGKSNMGEYSFGAVGGELNYYFFLGPTPAGIASRFAALTGTMPLPPMWALGYQQSRWSYSPESRVREIASLFRSKKIPCDVLYLDIDYMDGYRCFTWGTERFPNPKKLISDLASQGFQTAVIIDPGIKQDSTYWVFREGLAEKHFVMKPDGTPFLGKVWPGVCAFPDFSSPSAREWWGSLYKGLIDDGVRGFWNDMNEPSVFDVPSKTFDLDVRHDNRGMGSDHRSMHNVYGMQMARGSYEGVRKLRPEERPFVLTRADYAGGQRYTSAWTGDNVSSWDHLKMAVTMCLNVSISGQPFIGTDIGGFIGNPSGELFARWIEFGVFTPLMRAHSVIDARNKEPWEFGPETEEIVRNTIGLRYQFLPYIYSSFRQASLTGIPMMRPVVFDYYDDQWTHHNDEQYLFGDALLIAPVVQPGVTKKHVRLPAGTWYNFATDERFNGPTDIDVAAPLDRLPIFVKAGSVIPMQPVIQHTGERTGQPLTLHIYSRPGANGISASGSMYEDDGLSYKYLAGDSSRREITFSQTDHGPTLSIGKSIGGYHLPGRMITAVVHDIPAAPAWVAIDNRKVPSGNGQRPNNWSYDSGSHTVHVTMAESEAGHIVTFGGAK